MLGLVHIICDCQVLNNIRCSVIVKFNNLSNMNGKEMAKFF